MTTMNISLPEKLKDFVDTQVKNKRYGTSSEYVRRLIREKEIEVAEAELLTLLEEGMNSGFIEIGPNYFRNRHKK